MQLSADGSLFSWEETSKLDARIAFICLDIDAPSQLWARRIFFGLLPNVKILVTRTAIYRVDNDGKLVAVRRGFLTKRFGRVTEKEVRKALVSSGVEIVVVNFANVALNLQAAWQNLKVRVVVYCHGIDVHFDSRSETFPNRRIHERLYKQKLRNELTADVLIANSLDTRARLIDAGFEPGRISLFRFGVHLPENSASPSLEDGPFRLLFLGRLVDFKGPDLVVDGFHIAVKRGLNAALKIAGDGHLMTTCQLKIHECGLSDRVEMVGSVSADAARTLFRDANLFVSHHRLGPITNRVEAFGVTLIEAMSFGLPVLTGKSGGVVDIVRESVNGHLVNPGDSNGFADKLLDLASNRDAMASMSAGAITTVRQEFSVGQQAESWRRLIEGLN